MSRPRHTDPPVYKKIALRTSTVKSVDVAIVDPLTGGPRYGAWGELVDNLLDQWLEGKIKGPFEPFRANLEDLANGDRRDKKEGE